MKEAKLKVISNRKIACGIYELVLYDEKLEEILPGQFANLQIPNRGELILKRPLGITAFDKSKRTMTVCYQVSGKGTEALTQLLPGVELYGTYPLGNGFALKECHKKIMLVGGGVGVFPLLSVPLCHSAKYYTYLGFRDAESAVYADEFRAVSEEMRISTENGSLGQKGYATDGLGDAVSRIKPNVILSCGPMPMFVSLKKALAAHPGTPCQVSVEERMGCGVGACLVCVCKIKRGGKATHKRVCADGPVFDLSEVIYDE